MCSTAAPPEDGLLPPAVTADIDLRSLEDGTADDARVAVDCAGGWDLATGTYETVLSCVLKKGHHEAAMLLLARGVPRTLAAEAAREAILLRPPALHVAALHGNAGVLTALLAAYREAGVTPKLWQGLSAYHCAAWRGNTVAVVQMREWGVPGENVVSPAGFTPAALAAARGYPGTLHALCAMGVALEAAGNAKTGNILHAAARGGRYWYARACPTAPNFAPCLTYAPDGTHGKEAYLPEYEAPAAGAYYDVVGILLARGMEVNEPTTAGMTPLLLAAQGQNIGAVDRLLDAGADVTVKDARGRGVMWHLTGVASPPTVAAIRAYCDAHRGVARPDPAAPRAITNAPPPPPRAPAPKIDNLKAGLVLAMLGGLNSPSV